MEVYHIFIGHAGSLVRILLQPNIFVAVLLNDDMLLNGVFIPLCTWWLGRPGPEVFLVQGSFLAYPVSGTLFHEDELLYLFEYVPTMWIAHTSKHTLNIMFGLPVFRHWIPFAAVTAG